MKIWIITIVFPNLVDKVWILNQKICCKYKSDKYSAEVWYQKINFPFTLHQLLKAKPKSSEKKVTPDQTTNVFK